MTLKRVLAWLFTLALLVGAGEAVWRTNPFTHSPEPVAARTSSPSPAQPSLAAPTITTKAVATELTNARMVAFADGRLLVGDKSSGLHVYRSGSGGYAQVGATRVPGEPVSAVGTRGRASVSCAWGGLAIVDLSKPASPTVTGSYPTDALTRGSDLVGNGIIIADWNAGLHLLDARKTGKPRLAGTLVTPGHACGVVAEGRTAYVADFEGGVHVVDVSDPSRPTIVDTYPAHAAAAIASRGTTLFVADEQQGVLVLDVSQPKAIRRLSAYPMQGKAHALSLAGDVLVVSDLAGDVFVLDVTVPALPTLRGVAHSGGTVYSVTTDGRTLVYAAGTVHAAPIPRESR